MSGDKKKRPIPPPVPRPAPLREGLDFYIENGLYVFTEHYLRQRGYCCQSGCRHCPYGFRDGLKNMS
ncbi:MAG: hypothetical protein KF852_07860 [Saprospiraceae bacterium]|nr:hypothetical protein [Saprospiraceae bacterium]